MKIAFVYQHLQMLYIFNSPEPLQGIFNKSKVFVYLKGNQNPALREIVPTEWTYRTPVFNQS